MRTFSAFVNCHLLIYSHVILFFNMFRKITVDKFNEALHLEEPTKGLSLFVARLLSIVCKVNLSFYSMHFVSGEVFCYLFLSGAGLPVVFFARKRDTPCLQKKERKPRNLANNSIVSC